MADLASRTEKAFDLTNCDREPIHIPGSIQPHGVLMVLKEPELSIVQVSSNSDIILGISAETLLESGIGKLLDRAQVEELKQFLHVEQIDETPLSWAVISTIVRGQERWFNIIIHRYQGLLILDVEPADRRADEHSPDLYFAFRKFLLRLKQAPTLNDFCQAVTEEVRRITGFDRVMIYRFDEDWHGVVVAESLAAGVDSFLGLHYPASDIPRQARELYCKNWLRLITDVDYEPVPIVPSVNPVTGKPLDLSYSTLRSVSPIHIEYLKNMQVRSSMSISLIKDEQLWGLISCHHERSAGYVSAEVRTVCEFLGQMVSLQLSPQENKEDFEYRNKLKTILSQLSESMLLESDVIDGLTADDPDILDLMNAGGAAFCFEGQSRLIGNTPTHEQVEGLLDWLKQNMEGKVYATHSLSQHYPTASVFCDVASGLLAISVSKTPRDFILCFRPEVVQTVHWVGNPNKPVEYEDSGELRLHPRKSFDQWKQTVHLKSQPWNKVEIEAAQELWDFVRSIQLQRNSAELVELVQARQAADLANRRKTQALANMSHELRTPLNAIIGYSEMLAKGMGGELNENQAKYTRNINASGQHLLEMVNDILDISRIEAGKLRLAPETIDLSSLIKELRGIIYPMAHQRNLSLTFELDNAPASINADPARFKQILLNLINNAVKFNREGGHVIVRLYQESEWLVCEVQDTGVGIPRDKIPNLFSEFYRVEHPSHQQEGTGLGLALTKRLVELHRGTIAVESQEGVGSTFTFRLPVT